MDFEAWYAAIDSRIIDQWIAFNKVEPGVVLPSPATAQPADKIVGDDIEKSLAERFG